MLGTFICGIGAGAIGFVPDHAWGLFAVLRFVVGFGLTAAVTPCLTIVVEQAPTRYRTSLSSFYVVFATAGTLVASATSAALLSALGWRGVAMLGALPVPVGIAIALWVPESVRWLTAKGRFAEARAQVAHQLGLPLEQVPLPTMPPVAQPSGRHGGTVQPAAPLLGYRDHLGRLLHGGVRRLSLGADDRGAAAAYSGAAGGEVFRVRRRLPG